MITEWRFAQSNKYPNRIFCDSGEVYNAKNGKKMNLKPSFGGYLRIRLYNKGKELYKWVHRIVYELFVDSDIEKYHIHHINKNNQDNYYKNLEKRLPDDHYEYHKWDRRKQKDEIKVEEYDPTETPF